METIEDPLYQHEKEELEKDCDLLRQLEDKRRCASNPKEQMNLEEQIRDLKDTIDGRKKEIGRFEKIFSSRSSYSSLDIPFVIFAMTREEVNQLIEETIFKDAEIAPIELSNYQNFKKTLQEHKIELASFLSHYGEHREEWQPYNCPNTSIQEIIVKTLDSVNEHVQSETSTYPLIKPEFVSANCLNEDRDTRQEIWRKLDWHGGVLVIDSVSLFHPFLLKKLSSSGMCTSEKITMLVLSPISACSFPVNQSIEGLISSKMERAFARFNNSWDRLCEVGLGDLRAIQRWLFATIPETARIFQQEKPYPGNRKIWRKHSGQPRGQDQLLYGPRNTEL